mgnify:CR=1 FL=1
MGDDRAESEGLVLNLRFDEAGLLPAVVADAASGEVLMLAYMNAEALRLTLATGIVHFWSRSRGEIWKKGETSGNTLRLREAKVDCDQDTLLLKVAVGGAGAACHTGRRSCFYRSIDLDRPATGDGRVGLRLD